MIIDDDAEPISKEVLVRAYKIDKTHTLIKIIIDFMQNSTC